MVAAARPVGGVGDMGGGLEDWFKSLPVITRYWFAATFLMTCGISFNVIDPMVYVFNYDKLKHGFEVWRLVTPFCIIGKFSFPTAISLYMMVQYSQRHEMSPYNTGGGSGTADYATTLLFGMTVMLLLSGSGFYPLVIMCQELVYMTLYLWSKRDATSDVSVYGFNMKAKNLPFVYVGVTVVMGNDPMPQILGIATGHLYYFLVEVVPAMYGTDLIHTPSFLVDYFGPGQYVAAAGGGGNNTVGNNTFQAPGRVNPPANPGNTGASGSRGGGYSWGGGGQRLGSN
mmetsp:Transcript_33471/g.77191  ORF Transcript_33471/g.77191 Transcript_33471/m.77191 type:complete len:285 (-) Transcript_33471:223-1077(-)|eukprot:CAMPEP_0113316006 /NCGR_PEP_ID=MMETSP0010_2-20120614/11442_1 /TAXON_ID=216773 ORGANISM="Corethron hystrix, Strain 308" /NCGR_SAMPLE_ID=MMETSP0010_2 /ASSEMBLY_ACC=CAM_ASM_000155 /LENGTH=284 /DNA_ID=CAMNT_0000172611 /DNA_START=167 /DNA_END=1021 /DNA_ORIENTATION=+ /assembly_acc=CAM_ASM_000155